MAINVLEQLGKRIVFLRKQRNLSQLELSIASDINRNYLSDLENGRRNPSVLVLAKISDALGVSMSELFKGIDNFL